MRQHLHFYTTAGRCTQSIPLSGKNVHSSVEATVPSRIQFQLIGSGFRLARWHDGEQAGIAIANGTDEYVLRIKSDSTMRDMRPIGASQMLRTIRSEGVDVEALTGRLAA